MFRPILRSKARWIMPYSLAAPPRISSVCGDPLLGSPFSALTNSFLGLPTKCSVSHPGTQKTNFIQVEETHFRSLPSVKRNPVVRSELAKGLTKFKLGNLPKANNEVDSFDEMKERFLNFKKCVYLEELEHYHRLAQVQAPKPGEAFMIRNVANFVPPLENGPSETNAALEFAVNTLEVENILVVGHSRCGGIETLMSMQDDVNSSFVHNWITKAKAAKFRTKVSAPQHSFDQQCRHCEKESVNISLLNLLTYPWIEDRVRKEQLSIHGGYYDFLNCTFEKWTLDFESSDISGGRYLVKDQALWS